MNSVCRRLQSKSENKKGTSVYVTKVVKSLKVTFIRITKSYVIKVKG